MPWSQFHADGANRGSLFVKTINSLRPAWSVDVGHVVFSSPSVGPDGTIYIGNLEGELIAVNPDGTVKWRFEAGAPILASAAVAENGFIYVLSTASFPNATPPDNKLQSQIAMVDSSGGQHQRRRFPNQGFTTGSPKVFTVNGATFLAVHVRTRFDGSVARPSALLVYDERLNLVGRRDLGCGVVEVVGHDDSFFSDIVDFFKDVIKLNEFDASAELLPINKIFGELDPSVAVVQREDLAPQRPIIVVADRACAKVHAFRWSPPELVPVWEQKILDDERPLVLSSPAVLNEGTLVTVGTRHGTVVAYDLASGTQRWVSNIEEAGVATPASSGGLIFVASSTRLHALNAATGVRVHESRHEGIMISASPAVSSDKIHLQSRKEISTFPFDFSSTAHDEGGFGGTSSPAIGDNGAVYAVVQPGDPLELQASTPARLVAYPPPKPGPGGAVILGPPDGRVLPVS